MGRATSKDAKEYCEAETFDPECQPDEVVVITAAYYGRMKKGRCAKTDYGFIGCYEDVLTLLDYRCSGRDTCNIRLPDLELDAINPCPPEFKTYLNASYTCVQVESAACQMCSRHLDSPRQARLTLAQGYIASWITKQYDGCGSASCPWLIEVQPGQKINITLYDFSDKSKPITNTWIPNTCNRFGVIKETAAPTDKPICKGQKRERHLYTSVSNSLEIHVVSPEVLDKAGQFLLYYEAVGCPDYDPPDNTYIRREDDHITIGCEATRQEWDLYCKGTEWQGQIGVCPGKGVLIAIVIGIALVIGVSILTVGIVCLKRHQHNFHRRSETTLYVRASQEPDYREGVISETRLVPKYDTTQMTLTQKPPNRVALVPPVSRGPGTAAHGAPRENLYCRRMESRPLPSLPNLAEQPPMWAPSGSDDDVDRYRVQVHRTGSGREQHCHYQPRVVTKRAHSTGSSSRDDPQYFVLDPDDLVVEGGVGGGGVLDEPVAGPSAAPMKVVHHQAAVKLPAAVNSGALPAKIRNGAEAPPPAPPVGVLDAEIPEPPLLPGAAAPGPSGAAPGKTKPTPPPKPNQKSPEQENVENDTKEVHNLNNSCHEIPLRPSREGSQTNKVPDSSSNTGNSSWP
ncbi:hypothetical protein LSH36_570g03021 [Paralvinella palmiformis]|uniref:SUEL-type lectin domain-containing protein n=1 Tax=Paralvinella palmiformis TaxID=53620 RepID=A0AAD9J7G9_9ANNE|nr:hypothetical protein LSH36_570g03021 [Paralvinella palmiformis]